MLRETLIIVACRALYLIYATRLFNTFGHNLRVEDHGEERSAPLHHLVSRSDAKLAGELVGRPCYDAAEPALAKLWFKLVATIMMMNAV